jgi:putative salt-induced outer membrane protein YdiY
MRFVAILALLFHFSAHAEETPKEDTLGFHHESQLSYIVVGGNAKSESFSGKQTSVYNWEKDIAKLSAHYLSAKSQDQATRQTSGTAENWSTIGRWEHIFIPDTYSGFLQAGVSGDRFIGVQLAQAYDLGAKYFWVSNDRVKFFSELGYRYLHEDLEKLNITSEKESHFIRLYSQIDYTHTDSVKVGLWAEYLPDMKDNENYRINFSPYLLAILSDTFSLKFGYEGYYRNLPVDSGIPGVPNNVHFDFRHVTALIAKF